MRSQQNFLFLTVRALKKGSRGVRCARSMPLILTFRASSCQKQKVLLLAFLVSTAQKMLVSDTEPEYTILWLLEIVEIFRYHCYRHRISHWLIDQSWKMLLLYMTWLYLTKFFTTILAFSPKYSSYIISTIYSTPSNTILNLIDSLCCMVICAREILRYSG